MKFASMMFVSADRVRLFKKHGLDRDCRGTTGVSNRHTYFMVIDTMSKVLGRESRYYAESTNKHSSR